MVLKSPRLLMDTTGWQQTEMAECTLTTETLKKTVSIYSRSVSDIDGTL